MLEYDSRVHSGVHVDVHHSKGDSNCQILEVLVWLLVSSTGSECAANLLPCLRVVVLLLDEVSAEGGNVVQGLGSTLDRLLARGPHNDLSQIRQNRLMHNERKRIGTFGSGYKYNTDKYKTLLGKVRIKSHLHIMFDSILVHHTVGCLELHELGLCTPCLP